MVPSNAPFKPSPLSFASPRASPFRRPSTPNSPPAAQTGRPSTPGSSPGRGYTPVVSPSKLNQSYTAADEDGSPKSRDPIPQPRFTREVSPSPTRGAASPDRPASSVTGLRTQGMVGGRSSDAVSRLSPAQLREIREAFQVLDRDNDGSVDRDDVADVLSNVGQDPSSLSQFFPPGSPQTINFPTFLNILSTLLEPLSSRQELVNALAAFDEDDSGQIDVSELRDALLHTAPEDGERPLSEREINQVLSGFTGRRAFGAKMSGGSKRGDVFRYHEFVDGIMGGTTNNAASQGRAQS
ncbi:EF-hand [Aspergillus taichungensis]|uniref:EF-hand n=1 Tax=Aspergillus taichungensis TaxID=482145 RepID=A0A2J5HML1_9EURO|nr:EF-hand [Aspergillus taichungensis]